MFLKRNSPIVFVGKGNVNINYTKSLLKTLQISGFFCYQSFAFLSKTLLIFLN